MKNWFKTFALIAAVTATAACSSSDDEKDAPKEPTFPAMQTATIAAGETKTLTFDADADWKLIVDKGWCRFLDGEIETAQLAGKAAKGIEIEVLVKESGWDFEAQTAKIDLTMGSKSQSIFTIERPGMIREVKMWQENDFGSKEYTEIENIKIEYSKYAHSSNRIGFTANFDWKVLSISEGFEIDEMIAGAAGENTSDAGFKLTSISVKTDKVPYATSGKIVISDLEGNNAVEFGVEYTGMGDEDLLWADQRTTRNGVSFTIDGFAMDKNGYEPVPTDEKNASVSFSTKEMKYSTKFVVIENAVPKEVEKLLWLTVQDDKKGTLTFSASENTEAAREVYVFIMPEAMVFNLAEHFDGDFFQSDYGFKVDQAGVVASGGFIIKWGMATPWDEDYVEPVAVPFSEYSEFKGAKPSEVGFINAPENNTFVYEFSDANIKGSLAFTPIGLPSDVYPIDGLFSVHDMVGNWPQEKFEHASVYAPDDMMMMNPYPGLGIAPEVLKTIEGPTYCGVFFYENAEQKELMKPMAVLVLYKK